MTHFGVSSDAGDTFRVVVVGLPYGTIGEATLGALGCPGWKTTGLSLTDAQVVAATLNAAMARKLEFLGMKKVENKSCNNPELE